MSTAKPLDLDAVILPADLKTGERVVLVMTAPPLVMAQIREILNRD